MNKILAAIMVLLSFGVHAQINQITTFPFQPGEKLSFIVAFNMKGLMTELAGVNMEVVDVPGKKKPIYNLKFVANTLSSWDDYVKVRHAYQTYIDAATIKPLIVAQDSDVKGQITKSQYTFKHTTGIADIAISKNGEVETKSTLALKPNSFDVVSLIYLTRTLDYDRYPIGKNIAVNLVALERNIPLNIKYLGRQTLKLSSKDEIECYKIGFILTQKFIVEPNVTFMYLTADEKRLPVLITTVYKEGEVNVKLVNKN